MQKKKGSFLKERFSSSSAFVLLEALFSLMLSSLALSFFAFYLSLPKFSVRDQTISLPSRILSSQEVHLSSSKLIFKARRIRLKEGKNIYTSFEALQDENGF